MLAKKLDPLVIHNLNCILIYMKKIGNLEFILFIFDLLIKYFYYVNLKKVIFMTKK